MPKSWRFYLLSSLCALLMAVCGGAIEAKAQCPPLYTFTGEAAFDRFGGSVSGAGDVDNDGYDDVIVGAYWNAEAGHQAGRAYVHSGQTGALLYTFTGEAAGDLFGWSVSAAGDVDGDGYADLIVGAIGNDTGGNAAGRAYVYSGQTGALLYTFTGEAAFDRFGESVSEIGDIDNDGYADLIIGAWGNDAGGNNAGRAYVYSGQSGTLLYTITGEAVGYLFGVSVSGAGDVDDDGYADLIVGAGGKAAAGHPGWAYVYSGRTGLLLWTFTGEAAGDFFGRSVSGAGDVDDDGYADLIVGAVFNDAGGEYAGRAYVYSGQTGTLLYTFTGESTFDWFGFSVSGAGDVDDDGYAELIVGAHRNGAGGLDAGRAYVLFDAPNRGGAGEDPCACVCHADPQCDGVCDVLDVVNSVGVAFRGLEAPVDQECSVVRTDADCDDDTDVFDVVRFVNVAFRNQPKEDNFCDPLEP